MKRFLKNIVLLLVFSFLSFGVHAWSLFGRKKKQESPMPTQVAFEVHGEQNKYSKLKSLLLCQGNDRLMLRFAKIIQGDLDFTDQFDVVLQKTTEDCSRISSEKLFKQGTSLLFSLEKNKKGIRVTAKDTNSNIVVCDEVVPVTEKTLLSQAHDLSSKLLMALTGEPGVCKSVIAYCKMLSPKHKIICVADYACKQERVAVKAKTINVAPSWHTKTPVLFYSQITNHNNRLMSVDLRDNTHKVVCSYQGLNMQPSFSADGTKAVLCFSGGRGNAELYWYDQRMCKQAGKRVFQQLTKNHAHNVSPNLLPNGNVIFCSNYQTGMPQIYYLYRKTGEMRRLTGGKGYCAAPSYCAKTNMVVYTRPIKGTFQLFTLLLDDLDNLQERQITFGEGNKHEPSWSPCGRYIVFSSDEVDKKGRRIPQVSVLNYKSSKIRILTHSPEPKSFPRWTDKTLFSV